MKKMDLFCVSPASTAICSSSVDQGSIIRLGGKAIDRHNPHLRDARRSSSSNRTTSNTITTTTTKSSHLTIPSSSQSQSQAPSQSESHSKPSKKLTKFYYRNKKSSRGARKSSSSTFISSSAAKPNNLNISPPGSTRYLLSDTTSSGLLTEYEPLPSSLVSTESSGSCSTNKLEHDQCRALGPFSPPSSSASTTTSTTKDHQVVVLRVSLHCRGCEGKVRKHLSKMIGVASFNIDFAMKKVTVIGDVTPLSVLSSISRVKNAQFWPSLSSVKSAY